MSSGSNGISGGQTPSSNHPKHGESSLTELDHLSKSAKSNTAVVNDEEEPKSTNHAESGHSSEDSARKDILYAAGVGLTEDDPDLPCLTLRMWVIGIGFCLLGSGVNTLYTFRIPSITLSQSAIQFLAYPVGKAWYLAVPEWSFHFMGHEINTNPGPFNYKVCQTRTEVTRNETMLMMYHRRTS